ncbi:hypothetical protein NHX12_011557 [Muraenolepis orangiensis]|uniref:Uncharacterized protein n=1 Tax=Muraenolepis orangiensis TaxID=630683 RepID=A0A9Q0DGN2_9TELE|nr:hypothetical protein NHX12_011557 [Muraenolepis orangiensis]
MTAQFEVRPVEKGQCRWELIGHQVPIAVLSPLEDPRDDGVGTEEEERTSTSGTRCPVPLSTGPCVLVGHSRSVLAWAGLAQHGSVCSLTRGGCAQTDHTADALVLLFSSCPSPTWYPRGPGYRAPATSQTKSGKQKPQSDPVCMCWVSFGSPRQIWVFRGGAANRDS